METIQNFNLVSDMTTTILERILYYRHPFKGETITIDEYNNLDEFTRSYYKPLETFPNGTIVHENYSNRIYTFFDDYILMNIPVKDLKDDHMMYHPIKITDCPKCASNLPISKTSDKGICKCEYCGKEVYVW